MTIAISVFGALLLVPIVYLFVATSPEARSVTLDAPEATVAEFLIA